MIKRIDGFESKYYIGDSIGYEPTMFLQRYQGKVRCIICNESTRNRYFNGYMNRHVTVCNAVDDGYIYINHMR